MRSVPRLIDKCYKCAANGEPEQTIVLVVWPPMIPAEEVPYFLSNSQEMLYSTFDSI